MASAVTVRRSDAAPRLRRSAAAALREALRAVDGAAQRMLPDARLQRIAEEVRARSPAPRTTHVLVADAALWADMPFQRGSLVYMDAGELRVLLFRSPTGLPPVQMDAACDALGDAVRVPEGGRQAAASPGVGRIVDGDADDAMQTAVLTTLAALPAENSDAAAAAAALRRRIGPAAHVAHAAGTLRGALAAKRGSSLLLTWRGSTILVWQAEPEERTAVAALLSSRSVRVAVLAVVAALAAGYRSVCAPGAQGAATAGMCIAGRQLLAPLVGLFLLLSLSGGPVGRAVRAVLAPMRRTHVE